MFVLTTLTTGNSEVWSWSSDSAAARREGDRGFRKTEAQRPGLSSTAEESESRDMDAGILELCGLGVGVKCLSRSAEAAPPNERPFLVRPRLPPSVTHTWAPSVSPSVSRPEQASPPLTAPTTVERREQTYTNVHHNPRITETSPTQGNVLHNYSEDCWCMAASYCATQDLVAPNDPIISRSAKALSNSSDKVTPLKLAIKQMNGDLITSLGDGQVKRGVSRHVARNTNNQERHAVWHLPGSGGCVEGDVCCRRRPAPPLHELICGLQHTQGLLDRVKDLHKGKGDAEFGKYPWQAAVLKVDAGDVVYVCGGALLDHQRVLTAAHCINGLQVSQLRVRLGEWDVKTETEFYSHLELPVATVQSHPQYNAGNLHNDIALITLKTTVDFSSNPHISPVCLPDAYSSFVGQRCYSTGWGKDAFGSNGKYKSVLQEVELPVVDYQQCQEALRHTRLGPSFTLHQGMLCAGGEEGRDTCKGDGGSPLVCPDPDGRSHLAGLVSWGVDCGLPGLPGVYVDVTYFLEWLRQMGVVSSY